MAAQRYRTILTFEGVETGDNRLIAPNALTTRALPLTLMGMTINPEFGGHGLAEVSGRIDTLERQDASSWIDEATGKTWGSQAAEGYNGKVYAWVGEGVFDEGEFGSEVERLVGNETLRGISVDLAGVESEIVITEVDEDGWPEDYLETVIAGEIAAATVCNTPAFRGCTITWIDDQGNPMTAPEPADETSAAPADDVAAAAADAEVTIGHSEAPLHLVAATELPAIRYINDGAGCEPCAQSAVDPAVITAAGGPLHPPAGWFADPALDGPTALTVDDDGRVYGHLATWGTCHLGYTGQCMTPPRSATGYSLFRLGAVRTAEGDDVAVGHITLGTGHANTDPARGDISAAAAMAHYDNTGTVVADIAAGEDAHGIWVAGAMRPGVTGEQLRTLRAAALSGDWRGHGRASELVAALCVNVPGFPIPRTQARVASGVVVALVAAGVQAQPSLSEDRRVDPKDGEAAVLQASPTRAEQLRTAMAIGTGKARSHRAGRTLRWRS